MNHFSWKQTLGPTVSLFASASTLICCALPALFITLGMGAALAGLVNDVPQLIWLSTYKIYVFGFAAFMLSLAGIMQYRARNLPCPIDAKQAQVCKRLRKISFVIYSFSVVIFLTGAFFAFIAPRLI